MLCPEAHARAGELGPALFFSAYQPTEDATGVQNPETTLHLPLLLPGLELLLTPKAMNAGNKPPWRIST